MDKIFKEYLDLNHVYYILVAQNKDDEDLIYRGDIYGDNGEISSKLLNMSFNEKVYLDLESKLFDLINLKCGLLINMYDEEYIEGDDLVTAINITKDIINQSYDNDFNAIASRFLELLSHAYEIDSVVGLYF